MYAYTIIQYSTSLKKERILDYGIRTVKIPNQLLKDDKVA